MSRARTMFFTALLLGEAWAVRGHFGHEWGAAWAGAIGAMAVVVIARRADWLKRLPVLAALGGVGWGAGGIMSYGVVIGYCRGTGFANVCYGYTMLAVIAGIQGFLGGGLLGLGLESGEERRPCWASLFTQMVAAGYLIWGILIHQFEWFMTPPRSELWAGCLGAALALAWFLQRGGFHRALRVAAYSALGAGFGFAFGNFLQTMGSAAGLDYNWWNVMEFTLGFCGGLGMAYGIVSREWPTGAEPSRGANGLAVWFVFLAIPAATIINTLDTESYLRLAERLGIEDGLAFARNQINTVWVLTLLLLAAAAWTWHRYQFKEAALSAVVAPAGLAAYAALYTIMSYIDAGLFLQPVDWTVSDTAYTPLLLLALGVWFVTRRREVAFVNAPRAHWVHWMSLGIVLAAVLLTITAISVNAHDGLPGSHERF